MNGIDTDCNDFSRISKSLSYLLAFGIFLEKYFEILILSFFVILITRKELLRLSKNILFLFLYILISSIIVLKIQNLSYSKFIQQYIVIFYMALCYLYVLKRCNINTLFLCYLEISLFVCILGLIQFCIFKVFEINIFNFVYGRTSIVAKGVLRITSIIDEPSYLSTLITPALFYFFDNWKENKIRFLIVFGTVILTFSTITYFIFLLMISYKILFSRNKKMKFIFCFLSLFLITSMIMLYKQGLLNNTPFYSVINKFDQTLSVFKNFNPKNFEKLNLSTYAFATNLWVSLNAPFRLFGTGLGSHELSYEQLYQSSFNFYGLNSADAYSMGIRLFSEFGLLGISILIVFLIKSFKKNDSISVSIFFYILTMLIRGGNYIRYGVVFFFVLFYFFGREKECMIK